MTPLSETDSEPAGPEGAAGLSQDERAELARLRSEVTELRSEQAGQPPRRRRAWRTPVAALLIVIGCVLAPVAVIGVWTANQVSDTNRYVANIEPLIHDPAIQNALTDKITVAITTRLNVTGLSSQAADTLTSRGFTRVGTLLKTFGPALSNAVTGYVHNFVHKVITSERFATAWVEVNRVAHQTLVQALSGQGGSVTVSNGQVTLDLAPFIAIVKQDLVQRGFTLVNSLPPIHPTIALFSSKTLVQAQTLYRL